MFIPDYLMDAYICKELGWTVQELRQTPGYIVDQIKLLWHLENVAEKAAQNGK